MTNNLEAFKKKCREFKLRITPQRIAIYKTIMNSAYHPITDMIYREVKKEFSNISFNTVHQTLLTFSELRLLDVVEGFGTPKRFDSNLNQHHHLYCELCGKIIDFDTRLYDELPVPQHLNDGFIITRKRVVISGICHDCKTQNNKRKNTQFSVKRRNE
jgi:Fur family peroxide stress response transcriptional regulator